MSLINEMYVLTAVISFFLEYICIIKYKML